MSKKPSPNYTPQTAFTTSDDFGMVYNLRQASDPKTGHRAWRKGEAVMENDIAISIRIDGRGAPKEMQAEIARLVRDQLNARFPVAADGESSARPASATGKIPPACCPQSLKEAAPDSVFLCTHHHRGEEHKEPFLVSIARVISADSKCIRVEWLSNTESPTNFSPAHGKEIRITRDVPRVIRQLHPIHEFNWDALSEFQRDCILKSNAHQRGGLADCPFCGATEAALDKGNRKGVYGYMDAPSGDHARTLHVVCLECGSGAPSAEVWNRRLATGKSQNA